MQKTRRAQSLKEPTWPNKAQKDDTEQLADGGPVVKKCRHYIRPAIAPSAPLSGASLPRELSVYYTNPMAPRSSQFFLSACIGSPTHLSLLQLSEVALHLLLTEGEGLVQGGARHHRVGLELHANGLNQRTRVYRKFDSCSYFFRRARAAEREQG